MQGHLNCVIMLQQSVLPQSAGHKELSLGQEVWVEREVAVQHTMNVESRIQRSPRMLDLFLGSGYDRHGNFPFAL